MQPLVSIIVPVYNASAHLARCVDSLAAQSHRRIEIILVDDGSTDGSGALCDDLSAQDNRITVIHQTNSGVSTARNVGIAHSTGDFIQFVDADDFVDPQMTELLVRRQERAGSDIVICGYRELTPNGEIERVVSWNENTTFDHHQLLEVLPDLSRAVLVNSSWNKLYRASLISDHGISFPQEMAFAEDMMFVVRYLDVAGLVTIIPESPYNYLRYENVTNLSRLYRPKVYEIRQQELDAILSLFRDGSPYSSQRDQLEKEYALYLATDIVPYIALRIEPRSFREYLRACRAIRTDAYFVRHHRELRPHRVRHRVLLALFEASRFDVVYAAAALKLAYARVRPNSVETPSASEPDPHCSTAQASPLAQQAISVKIAEASNCRDGGAEGV